MHRRNIREICVGVDPGYVGPGYVRVCVWETERGMEGGREKECAWDSVREKERERERERER